MDAGQLRRLITDVLKEADLYSDAAVELLMLTAAQETKCGNYIEQVGGGPALGIFQMEPATHDDLYDTFLDRKPTLAAIADGYFSINSLRDKVSVNLNLRGNIPYQIVMARIKYYRDSAPMPKADDVEGLARYWKRVWNTPKGKGTVEEAITNYNKYAKQAIGGTK